MALHKLSVELAGLGDARALDEYLGLVEPVPVATSLFENAVSGGWRLDAYFEAEPNVSALTGVAAEVIARAGTFSVEAVPDENWVAISQAALPPVEAGRFYIHGSHDRHRAGGRLNAILIDAGEAFGTAHHATTEGCLKAIDALTRRRTFNRVLDLGCGSGVLAIAAGRALPRAALFASDIDRQAVAVAVANFQQNRLGGRVHAVAATGLAHARLRRQRYDLVLANILAGPLISLARHLAGAVMPGGVVVLSGLLDNQSREVVAAYRMAGFRLRQKNVLAGWATLIVEREAGIVEREAASKRHQSRQLRGVNSWRARTL